MKAGCYTAIATPFQGDAVDYAGLAQLVEFQIENGITGILAVGTTGESPTLTWNEHNKVVETVTETVNRRCLVIAGAGSNNTHEALAAARHAAGIGVDAVLLVDPYYNGPSSLEIRREYMAPVARAVPDVEVIPYVIPGRTGAQLLPEDLPILHRTCANVTTVKEATGNLENMKRTRACCGPDFTILSGDDALTLTMMTDPDIRAAGVISVLSNVVPAATVEMTRYLLDGDIEAGRRMAEALTPLFDLVTVKTREATPYGEVICRARNPLALKTLMAVLGMPSGGCRQPLGRMTKKGFEAVVGAARKTHATHPEILKPVADFFGVDISHRLKDPSETALAYESY